MTPPADIEDSRTRDRRLCRAGWRRAWGTALALVAAIAILGREPPPEEPATVLRRPRWTWVLPGSAAEAALADVRAVRSPTAFALPTAAGFTAALRSRMPRLAPPVRHAGDPAALAAAIPPSPAPLLPGWTDPDFAARVPAPPPGDGWKPVFANRRPPPDLPRMDFPAGWEPRIFAGLDLAYADWVDGVPWTASADIRFDAQGIPLSVLLDRSSGIPAVDKRIARSASGWRLLDPDAPRHGKVSWRVPAPAGPQSGEVLP